MAKFRVYSIFDDKAETYGPPVFYPNKSVAMRSFSDTVRNPDSMLYRHPADFRLYELGVFCDATGTFDCYEKHLFICHATTFVLDHQNIDDLFADDDFGTLQDDLDEIEKDKATGVIS